SSGEQMTPLSSGRYLDAAELPRRGLIPRVAARRPRRLRHQCRGVGVHAPTCVGRPFSGGTRSDVGRDCRAAFLGLAKTCAKLGIAFWDYLGARWAVPGSHVIPPLPQIILARARSP